MSKTDRSEIAKEALKTMKRKELARKVAKYRIDLTCEVKDMLKVWNRESEGKIACIVCGDYVPKTILQKHHFNPLNKSEGKYWLCGSCHNIFNKIKLTTTRKDVERDLNLRHERIRRKVTP